MVKPLILCNSVVKMHKQPENPSLKMLLCFLGIGCSVRENRKTRDCRLPLTISSCTCELPSTDLEAMGNGWQKGDDGCLKPLLMTRDAAPKGLAELTVCKCIKTACKSASCVCRVNGLYCTEACARMACDYENPHTGFDELECLSDDEE